MQLGFADHWTIVAPSADLRYVFSFDGRSEREIHRLRPYLQGGIGLAYVDHRRRDGVGFLMNGGFGVEYPLNESAALVSSMRFNGVPDGAGGEHFFYSWQLLGAQLRF
jgi:hypothetical protein